MAAAFNVYKMEVGFICTHKPKRHADVVLQRCSPAMLRVLLLMKTLENDRYGSLQDGA